MKEASEHRKVLAIKSIIRQFSGERLELKVMDQGGDLAVYTLDEAQAETTTVSWFAFQF